MSAKLPATRAISRPLIDTINSCVAKETWAKNGKGSAEIRSPKPGLLVITQTQAVHNDIRNLLTTLDEMRRDHQADISGPPPKGGNGRFRGSLCPSHSGGPRRTSKSRHVCRSCSSDSRPRQSIWWLIFAILCRRVGRVRETHQRHRSTVGRRRNAHRHRSRRRRRRFGHRRRQLRRQTRKIPHPPARAIRLMYSSRSARGFCPRSHGPHSAAIVGQLFSA